ncbi:MAG: peptidoglycan-binding protein [Planctomycetes bacterium]|nr:peptidoglycan-binding protein [Planctomycetota bacterium]
MPADEPLNDDTQLGAGAADNSDDEFEDDDFEESDLVFDPDDDESDEDWQEAEPAEDDADVDPGTFVNAGSGFVDNDLADCAEPQQIDLPGRHAVRQGESLPSIAALYRFGDQDAIWQRSQNAALRSERDPELLFPGDQVFVPERKLRNEPAAVNQRHRFRLKEERVWLRLVLKDEHDDPRAQTRYTLKLDTVTQPLKGITADDGLVEALIPAPTRLAQLELSAGDTPDAKKEVLELLVSQLDPISKPTGVQARLNNLGYRTGRVDSTVEEDLADAVRRFQLDCELPATGELDEQTRQKLVEMHGC